ncbi:MAG: hypothetical protein KAG94_03625 [Clostridiales bacterium]|nr:hypothetical protein [Clostridiales bacterium]
MKKAALLTIGIVLFTILVGFNFLLWDNMVKKENLQRSEEISIEKQDSIDSLLSVINEQKRVANELRDVRDELQAEVNIFDETESTYQLEISDLTDDNQELHSEIYFRGVIIKLLKEAVDNDYFTAFISDNWATYINNKDFYSAYLFQNSKLVLGESNIESFSDFQNQYVNVENIEVVSAKRVEIEQGDDQLIDLLHFSVNLQITLKKDSEGISREDEYFVEGENFFTFTFDYEESNLETWIITSMK